MRLRTRLVAAHVSFESVAALRKESEEATKQIRSTVEAGKKRFQETVAKYARSENLR